MENVRSFAAVAVAALVLVPVGAAKFRITLVLSPTNPRVGQVVRVTLRTDTPARVGVLRLVAVPPGTGIYAALDQESRYRLPLRRVGGGWRAVARFTRAGSWRLVVPNWGAPGYAIPPPVVRSVLVRAAP